MMVNIVNGDFQVCRTVMSLVNVTTVIPGLTTLIPLPLFVATLDPILEECLASLASNQTQ